LPHNTVKWASWAGKVEEIAPTEMKEERLIFDINSNVCLEVASESKLACNTNTAFLVPGPTVRHVAKCVTKPTQKDEHGM
jgi:hypothetical protein